MGKASGKEEKDKVEQAKKQVQDNNRAYFLGLGTRCEQYGFKNGTTAYSKCIQDAHQQDNAYMQNQNAIQFQQDQQNRQNMRNSLQPLIDIDKTTREQFKSLR